MSEQPVVDDRDRNDLRAELVAMAENYTDEWDPTSQDVGTTLFEVFSRFESDVIGRLNEVPDKHRVAFLDALGFDRRPPQAARLPLTFRTADDVGHNVVVPGGTQAIATTDDGGSVIFEVPTDADFEATPATLTDVYGVDPGTDTIVDHTTPLEQGDPATLFTGTDRQRHALYLGHGELLNLAAGSTITVTVLTNAVGSVLEEDLDWEYYGVADDGSEDWHPLEHETEEIRDLSELDIDRRYKWEVLRERIREFTRGDPSEWGDNSFELTFRLPGDTQPTAVDRVDSRWIRAIAPERDPEERGIEIETLAVNVKRSADEGGIGPETLLSNDIPLSVEGDEVVEPFGRSPQPSTTMYVASEEALTKVGATVSLEFTSPADRQPTDESDTSDDTDEPEPESESESDGDIRLSPTIDYGIVAGDPYISWEYWNGNGWDRLRLQADGTDAFTRPGTVSFVVPDDLEATMVSGHDGYWIRARLVSGNYGQPRYEITEDGTRGDVVEEPDPPRFGDVQIHYDQGGESFEHVVTDNNLTYRHVPPGVESDPFTPFVGVPDETQTLYLGFDATLRDGPIPLFIPVEDINYPRQFDPGMQWEYCSHPHRDTWDKLDVRDGTDGLTDRGIVLFTVPGETEPVERFGSTRHWIRVRVTEDEFQPRTGRPTTPAGSTHVPGRFLASNATPGTGRQGAGDSTAGGDMTGDEAQVTTPPTLTGIHPNTQWADNAKTIEDERLGSSDGSADQTFACDNTPVTDIQVWVDESPDLSEGQRRDLADRRPGDVRREADRFWVRWTEVSNFLESTKDDRHYTVDRTAGTVTFGDGQRGTIPPADDGNVRATYKTGGGSDGNVDAGAIESLQTPISLIDSVTNLEPSDGGADVETMSAATTRGSERLRTRGRAVAAADFEAVARAASRELATVKCLPELDDTGARTPGWVTLLVVPRERRARPTPSVDLRQRVQAAVSERAPGALAGGDRIVVRGPRYAPVSVETSVSTGGGTSITTLKETVVTELDQYFHPLFGGSDGEGWGFGELPRPTAIATLIESVEGIEAVDTLTVWVSSGDERVRIPAGRPPTLPRDAMICSGTHAVAITMTAGDAETAGEGAR